MHPIFRNTLRKYILPDESVMFSEFPSELFMSAGQCRSVVSFTAESRMDRIAIQTAPDFFVTQRRKENFAT